MAKINIKTTQSVSPMIYAYTTPGIIYHDGWTKIGYTERDVDVRIREQTQTANIFAKKEWQDLAIFSDGKTRFTDKEFHSYLSKNDIERKEPQQDDEGCPEWFKITGDESYALFGKFRRNMGVLETLGVVPYKLREEQKSAVSNTQKYFLDGSHKSEFLWNAKPRFGKTLSAYDLCKNLNVSKILIVTNRPTIANSWYDDYVKFLGTESGYYFVSNIDGLKNKKYVVSRDKYIDLISQPNHKGCIEFVSLQDLKGSLYFGGAYDKLKEVEDLEWDILVIDEAHEGVDTYKTDVAFDHIKRKYTLHLSGTPFKALANEKFNSKAIFNWTYAQEQEAKRNWDNASEEENPYANLPQLNLYTYKMSEIVREKIELGADFNDDGENEEYCWDLNEFFKTNTSGKFIHDDSVDKFLDALTTQEKFPFSTEELRNELNHTLWILKYVSSAKALAKKLNEHPVFKNNYEVVLAAGDGKLDDEGNSTDDYEIDSTIKNSYDKVKNAIETHKKTITISVGQLTTGITIPEWTAVMMLSNVKSPALYMQAAFRAQNPCLFNVGGKQLRKENAYVFDFDPARTLTIVEEFANDLLSDTANGKGDSDTRKQHVRELLNFFPVYGEDSQGEMIALDAEKVLSIPRALHAKEVVKRGFMSNFLFQNIGNIFNAPKEVIDILQKFEPIKEPVGIKDDTKEKLDLDDKGEVQIPEYKIIGTASEIFGSKLYGNIEDSLINAVDTIQKSHESNLKKDETLEKLLEVFHTNITDKLVEAAKENYGSDISKSSQNDLVRKINAAADIFVKKQYGDYQIQNKKIDNIRNKEIEKAKEKGQSYLIEEINKKFDEQRKLVESNFIETIHSEVKNVIDGAGKTIVETVETDKKEKEKNSLMDNVRDHLRGFSRTIPSFIMAYGNDKTTLEVFDKIIPNEVFIEVTSISLDEFRKLRDGFDYVDEDGKESHYNGFFDSVVFNDSIKEFLILKQTLSNYFEENMKEDIFDYIPPQKTNQIFTPKKVVKEMVDNLEKENPGCFDNPNHTFMDLYMKSGLYIAEIVKRLYRSNKLKQLYPNNTERLKHIFEKQVYGCAPTEIIYRIAMSYILGFNNEIKIEKFNLKQFDTLPSAKDGTLETELDKIFNN